MPFLLGCLRIFGQETVSGQDAGPARFTGYISSRISAYDASGISPRMGPFTGQVYGDAQLLTSNGLSVPLRFILSSDRRKFRQPLNTIGISPKWRWVTAHLGYNSIYFNPFTLAGHSFLGGGLALYPGKFRFEAVYGRFLRPVAFDTVVLVDNHTLYATPAYDRRGYAFKVGAGSPRNYVDLIFLSARDDKNNIPEGLPSGVETTPAENVAAGVSSKLSFGKKWTWTNEGGLSVYTRDSRAERIEPGNNAVEKFAATLLHVNLTTQYALAAESALQFNAKNFGFQLKYRRIDPGYRSMGAYYFLSDLENITIAPSCYLWKRKVRIAIRGGLQHDNLQKQKKSAVFRTIGSTYITIQPGPKFGLSLQYGNYGYERQPTAALPSDTIRLRQVNQSASVSPRLTIVGETAVHTVFALWSMQALQNGNSNLPGAQDFRTWFGNLVYALNLKPAGITLNAGFYAQNSRLPAFETGLWGLQGGAGKSLLDKKLTASLTLMYGFNRLDNHVNGSTANVQMNLNYLITPQYSIRTALYFLKNTPGQVSVNPRFQEMRGQLELDYRF